MPETAADFAEDGTPTVPNLPALIGGECVCGHRFIPMQSFGCEKCGRAGDDLTTARFSGRGQLRAFAEVYRHHASFPATPFTVVTVALDDGPIVRALLDPPMDAALEAGQIMIATLGTALARDGAETRQIRFKRAPERP